MKKIEDQIIVLLTSPKSAANKNKLRLLISNMVKDIFDQHAAHGDRESLRKFIVSKGFVISATNYDRILATETDKNIEVDEKTQFVVLRHASIFFGIDITLQLEELLRELDSYKYTIV